MLPARGVARIPSPRLRLALRRARPSWRCPLFYPTNLDDETTLYLEAETSGAFAKNDLEIRPDPLTALASAIVSAEKFSRYIAKTMKPALREHGMDAEITFGVRCDGFGAVMIAQDLGRGQLTCKLTIRPG